MSKPTVVFLCTHNAGRSQLGAALLEHVAPGQFDIDSAGVAPADTVNDAVAASLAELDIDITGNQPRKVTIHDLEHADYVIAMKPGLKLPETRRGAFLEWSFPDPASWEVEDVRVLRESVQARLLQFVTATDRFGAADD